MSTPTLSFPPVTVSIQPSENEVVHFLRCAPSLKGDEETGLLNLRLRITNKHRQGIRIRKIAIKVAGSPTAVQSFPLSLPAQDAPLLAPGASIGWDQEIDHVFAIPANPSLRLEISAEGFPRPAEIPAELVPHVNPTTNGSYRFWGQADDLEPGEYWRVHGTSHAQTRSQMFAYDVKVAVGKDGGYDRLKANPRGIANWGSENEHYRVWGKPIYAVAAGEVRHCLNDFPTNPKPGNTFTTEIETLMAAVGHGNGNFFTITSTHPTGENETVLYAHMQPGTLNEDLVRIGPGAQVNLGDFLGLAGNSGHSTEPHLHIHANRTNTGSQSWDDLARPMLFWHAAAIAWSSLTNFEETPWVRLGGRGMPTTDCAVWPGYPPEKRPELHEERTIDLLALLLKGSVYVDLTLPDPPPFEAVRERALKIINHMSPEEKRKALARLRGIAGYNKELQRELGR